ncbi:HAMP domain-containing histidine kinase [Flagellimonas sp. HMM57]|uniref:sensor histidine kinase n=1 Tax=unclassified Flagellimonas TaxID=2644544 RepID=UPI0013D17A83|nr:MULTISPECIES: HAMP domain-containing sensor histidine kinase [unclassified Flagellimonas]UII77845.1 HAMP domain-containing histidine kinase [Flagellimonas sp. HMM57]
MKIRNKITLIFVLLTAMLLLSVFLFIYFSVENYTQNEFYLRLKQRVSIAAQAYLEEDELSTSIYEDIRKKHLRTLPNEKEKILKVNLDERSLISHSQSPLQPEFFDDVFNNGHAEVKIKNNYYTAILYKDNQGDFIVVLSAEDLYGSAKMQNLTRTLLTAFTLSLILLFVIGRYYAKEVLKPILVITGQVNKIRAKNLHLRLATEHKKDELGELSRTFNTMLDRLETSFEMKSNFVHNASHELRNPLTAIIGQTEVSLNKARKEPEYIEALQTIEKEALRLDELINALLDLAHTEHDSKGLIIENIRADELLMEVKMSFDSLISNKINCNFQFLPQNSNTLVFRGNNGLMKVALLNILDNALKYSTNGTVDLSLQVEDNGILFSIKDKGIGIPKEDLKNVFEPFYRGSNARGYKGFGFGLALSQKIIRLHGGELKIYSEIEKGTHVLVQLPNTDEGFKIAR